MKRAMLSNTVTIILFVIIFIVLIPVATNIYNYVRQSSKDEVCRISVAQHSMSKIADPLTKQGFAMQCPRKEIIFYADQVSIDGKKATIYEQEGAKGSTKYSNLNDYIVDQVLARELVSCWDKMGHGNLNVFNAPFFFQDTEGVFNVQRKPCMICSTVHFSGIPPGVTYKTLKAYLTSKTFTTRDDQDINYNAFLDSKQYSGGLHSFGEDTLFEFDSGKSYTIYFSAGKTTRTRELITTVTAEYLKWEDTYSVHIAETGQMANKCTYIYN